MKEADTGDILLYKTKNVGGGLIRKFTSSEFDHVAMVLKFDLDQNEIYILEATGNRGVALNKWEYLRPHIGGNNFYSQLVFRHVDFNRSDEMVDNLELFLKESIGQKYGLSRKKLMNRKTVNLKKKT